MATIFLASMGFRRLNLRRAGDGFLRSAFSAFDLALCSSSTDSRALSFAFLPSSIFLSKADMLPGYAKSSLNSGHLLFLLFCLAFACHFHIGLATEWIAFPGHLPRHRRCATSDDFESSRPGRSPNFYPHRSIAASLAAFSFFLSPFFPVLHLACRGY